jgi:hypothetical protein
VAHICSGTQCLAPIRDLSALGRQLRTTELTTGQDPIPEGSAGFGDA